MCRNFISMTGYKPKQLLSEYMTHSRSLGYFNPVFFLTLCITFIAIISPVSGDNSEIYIASINLPSDSTIVSPGMNISPIITVVNRDIKPGQAESLKFTGSLGPRTLITTNAEWPVPAKGEERTYTIPFTIPSLQPGVYSLEIGLILDDQESSNGVISTMKAKTNIQVTHPKPGSAISDCGCS